MKPIPDTLLRSPYTTRRIPGTFKREIVFDDISVVGSATNQGDADVMAEAMNRAFRAGATEAWAQSFL